MQANMGSIDRAIRYLLVLVIVLLFATGKVHGALAVVLGAVGLVLLITAFIRYCPLYSVLRTSTLKKQR